MFQVTRCERVDSPLYKALVKDPCIRTITQYPTEEEANKYINDDIDDYCTKYNGNDIKVVRVEIPWQIGANLTDKSRFGGLTILYLKEEVK